MVVQADTAKPLRVDNAHEGYGVQGWLSSGLDVFAKALAFNTYRSGKECYCLKPGPAVLDEVGDRYIRLVSGSSIEGCMSVSLWMHWVDHAVSLPSGNIFLGIHSWRPKRNELSDRQASIHGWWLRQ